MYLNFFSLLPFSYENKRQKIPAAWKLENYRERGGHKARVSICCLCGSNWRLGVQPTRKPSASPPYIKDNLKSIQSQSEVSGKSKVNLTSIWYQPKVNPKQIPRQSDNNPKLKECGSLSHPITSTIWIEDDMDNHFFWAKNGKSRDGVIQKQS